MVESAGPKIISTLAVDYKPAITSTQQMMAITQQLDTQLRNLRITAMDVGRGIGTGFHQPIQSGAMILDRHGKVLVDLGAKAEKLATGTTTVNTVTKQHTKTVHDAAKAYSVLGSQWERRISWFVAGVGFYGFIRAMRQAVDTMRQVEMDMIVIQRTTNDVTFNFKQMRDELQLLGMQYGHTWETVSDIALRWTQAGCDMADTLEMTRVGLLALNVAEMDVQMASQGLIAIMSQWEFQANQVEAVIDKLNITSDNFAVTTGDLVDALVRSSGAARAVGISFEETLGIITAIRVATGRTGREVGNATNTMLSFLVRQQTINKLMESGIEVFADAAQTKLRPALEMLTDIADKWGNSADQMPDQLLDIAEQMGLMSEEMAEVVGLQEEWTDLQKIDIETSAAGVRRRSFFIALLRNFAQVQEVVNNMTDSEGYSMRQNILTMSALEKAQKQLEVSMERLAVAMGDAGIKGQLKGIIGVTADAIEWFNNLDDTLQTLIVSFATIAIATATLTTLLKMIGVPGALAALTKALGIAFVPGAPFVAGAVAVAALISTITLRMRQLTEEHEEYLEVISAVSGEMGRLDAIMERSVEGSVAYNIALDEKRELMSIIKDRYPELIKSYDAENRIWVLNNELIRKNIELYNEMTDQKIKQGEASAEVMNKEMGAKEKEIAQHEEDAKTVRRLFDGRERLIRSIEEEGLTAEESARRKEEVVKIDEAIIRITGKVDESIKTSADINESQINRMIDKYRELAYEAGQSLESTARAHRAAAVFRLSEIETEITGAALSLDDTNRRMADYELWLKSIGPSEILIGPDVMEPGITGTRNQLIRQLESLEQEEHEQRKIVEAADRALTEMAKTTASTVVPTGKLTEETRKLNDIINRFIETALRASQVQGMVNSETQRAIDLTRARIDYFTREGASAWERNRALDEEASLMELLKDKQQGIEQEANLLRSALERLEQRQRSINTSTDEGWDAYKRLESQIESIKGNISKLGIEWFNLAKAQEEVVVQTKRLQDNLKTLSFYERLGIMTVQELAKATIDAYSSIEAIRALSVEEERGRILKLSGYYKDMLRDMLRDAEESYKERVDLIDKAAEEEIAIYRRMLEALDEEKQAEDREESASQHVKKMQELQQQRFYHEQRTGIEHQRAIQDIDKKIAEEERRWELKQSEWIRQDKKDILNRQIDDIKNTAKEQQDELKRAYERMQADFSDHTLSMLAAAAAYDSDFWEDAKRKGELWLQGFKEGLSVESLAGFMGSLLGGAESRVESLTMGVDKDILAAINEIVYAKGEWQRGYETESAGLMSWAEKHASQYYAELPDDLANYLRSLNYEQALDWYKSLPRAHLGAETLSYGMAALKPGELIFPPNLSLQLKRLLDVLSARPLQHSVVERGRVFNFHAPFFNVEEQVLGDEVDADIVGRGIKRQLDAM